MNKFFSTLTLALVASSALATSWDFKCDVVDGRVKDANGKDQYVFECKCSAKYADKTVSLKCGGTSYNKETSCKSDYAYSEDKFINAAITSCTAETATIDANVNRGKHEAATFPLTCQYQAYSRACQGSKVIEIPGTEKPKCKPKPKY